MSDKKIEEFSRVLKNVEDYASEMRNDLHNLNQTNKQGRPLLDKNVLNYKLTINLSDQEIEKIKAKIAKEKPYCSLSTHIREILKQVGEI